MRMGVLCVSAVLAAAIVPPAKADDLSLTVGSAVGTGADYEGSDDYDFGLLPILQLNYVADEQKPDGGTELALGFHDASIGLGGIDVGFLKLYRPEGTYRLGLGLGYDGGRDADDNEALRGLGDIEGHAIGMVNLSYGSDDHGFTAGLQYLADLSSETDGNQIVGSVGYGFPLAEDVVFSTGAHMTWADSDYMQSYFGISSSQASRSAYNQYNAGSGLKDFGLNAGVNWTFYEGWDLFGGVEYTRLLGNAADSPIVSQKGSENQVGAMLGLTYRF